MARRARLAQAFVGAFSLFTVGRANNNNANNSFGRRIGSLLYGGRPGRGVAPAGAPK